MSRRKTFSGAGQYVIDFDNDIAEESPSQGYETADPSRKLTYISFGSGSSGNSCYLGTKNGGIIIDVGVDEGIIEKTLAANGIPMRNVKGILLTHDHLDHVKFVYKLLRTHKHMHLFCTNRVMGGLLRRHSISKRIKDFHIPIFKEIPFTLMDFEVVAFDVPHDGTDNMGFSIAFDKRRFVLATDLGEIQDRARHYMSLANYLVIESNYDSDMLRLGEYPEYLKARIRTANGHMDNADTARFLSEIAVGGNLRYVFLCHLSQDNNTPELAIRGARTALETLGMSVGDSSGSITDRAADIHLMALPRLEPSRCFSFRPLT